MIVSYFNSEIKIKKENFIWNIELINAENAIRFLMIDVAWILLLTHIIIQLW